jgi:predicted nucleic acid-binding protein
MICIDTAVLIWGVQGVAKGAHRQRMVDLTSRWLLSLKDAKEILMVPTPVLAEYLQGFPDPKERAQQLETLQSFCFIPAFDMPSAFLAADLSQSPAVQELAREGDRQALKTDVQIIATAITHQAEMIVTGNVGEFRRIARDRIPIREVPVVEIQGELDYGTSQA